MIILIGGESCTGKTKLAQQLLEKYHYPYLSIDHLKMGLIRGDFCCDFTVDTEDQIISNSLWSILKGIIETNIENNQHLIIEGCYLEPRKVMELKKKYNDEIVVLYLIFSKEYIIENYESKIIGYRNIIERRMYEEERDREMMINQHQALKVLCEKAKAPYFEIQSDYETEINNLLHNLEKQIRI